MRPTEIDVETPLYSSRPEPIFIKILIVALILLRHSWASITVVLLTFIGLVWVIGTLASFFLLFISLSVILYHAEDYLLYHPNVPKNSRSTVLDPSSLGLPHESINIRSSDGTLLHLYLIRHPDPYGSSAPTFLVLHGNAGNIGHWLTSVYGFFHHMKANLLLLEYRGYGLSQGTPSESGLYRDVRAAMDFLSVRSDINQTEIIIFGCSLGGAVAIDVAADMNYSSKIWCVILENTFTSIPDMALVQLGAGMRCFPLFCYKNKYMSINKIVNVTVPTLFISGLSDAIVPPAMMAHLHSKSNSYFKRCISFRNGTHNETWRCKNYFQAIANFLEDVHSQKKNFEDQQTVRKQPLAHSVIINV